MDRKEKTAQIQGHEDKSSVIHLHTSILIAIAMLVIGFIGGTVFGVMKTVPRTAEKSAASNEMPDRMFLALEEETVRNPQNADAWTRLGNAYFDSSQHQKAIYAYEKSLSISPDSPDVLTDLGIMYRGNKQPENAVEMFSKAMSLDSKHQNSRMNKGIVLLHDLKDEAGAVQVWEELLDINPLATFPNGQTVEDLVRHYKEGHENAGENRP
ncbi:MAG: tetratricopeptide repeat protein [Desulfobacterales bacterium]